MKRLVLASNNAGKIAELKALLPADVHVILQHDLGIEEVAETAYTFIENALIKARHAAKWSGLPALADDSGICVKALNDAPGIYSARYSGAGFPANRDKLLQAMQGVSERSASFIAVLAYVRHEHDPLPIVTTGVWHGEVSHEARGHDGFGYDPIFYLPELGKTVAELSPEEKNQYSHRRRALNELIMLLQQEI